MAGTKADVDAETGDGGVAGGGGGSGGSFSEQRLIDKLNRLNNSATSIQTLSQWCIFHRKRAKRVVDTWEKQFNSAREEKKISFLYLSNDILQNSKRKGSDYVDEFWRVLPRSLKHVYENGGEEGKKLVSRLILIWDERKVFGTRIESMKNGILGDNPPTLDNNGNSLNPSSNPTSNTKAARKDSGTIVKKLTVGGMPEKIVSAYQPVLDQHFDEDTALNKCKTTVGLLERINKDINDASNNGNQPASSLISDLQEQEMTLKQCIEQLESVDTARTSLINQLKEAISEQESKSVVLRDQLQVAQAEAQRVIQLREQLGRALVTSITQPTSSPLMITPPEQTSTIMQGPVVRSTPPPAQPLNPATSLPPTVSAVGDESKRTAAAMADKLASLSAPVQVLTSIFSSFAAEQAASINGGSPSGEFSGGPPGFQVDKRPRLEKTGQAADMGAPPFFWASVTGATTDWSSAYFSWRHASTSSRPIPTPSTTIAISAHATVWSKYWRNDWNGRTFRDDGWFYATSASIDQHYAARFSRTKRAASSTSTSTSSAPAPAAAVSSGATAITNISWILSIIRHGVLSACAGAAISVCPTTVIQLWL